MKKTCVRPVPCELAPPAPRPLTARCSRPEAYFETFDQSCFNADSVTAPERLGVDTCGVDTVRVETSGVIDVHHFLKDHEVVLEGGSEDLVLRYVYTLR